MLNDSVAIWKIATQSHPMRISLLKLYKLAAETQGFQTERTSLVKYGDFAESLLEEVRAAELRLEDFQSLIRTSQSVLIPPFSALLRVEEEFLKAELANAQRFLKSMLPLISEDMLSIAARKLKAVSGDYAGAIDESVLSQVKQEVAEVTSRVRSLTELQRACDKLKARTSPEHHQLIDREFRKHMDGARDL